MQKKDFTILSKIALRNYLFLALIATNTNVIKAQEKHDNNSYVTLNILSSADILAPRWRIGYIKDIKKNWKIGLDIGYGNGKTFFISSLGNSNIVEENYKLWEFRPEIYHFLPSNDLGKRYLSLEIFYINHKDIFFNNYFYNTKGTAISYESTDFTRQKYGFNLKYGLIIYSQKKLGLNFYSGLGLRIRKNLFSNTVNPSKIIPDPLPLEDLSFVKDEGFIFGLNFSLGVKLYYKL